ncbi:hypothetical protein ACDW39_15315|uniref:hypothetical protein n=1 Tax=Clostridioides difficile TaxID=1496 RepID=UPI0035565543
MKIGDKFENLTILDIEQRNSRKYCLCKCGNCGNEKWIRADSLKRIKACGCMKNSTQFKPNNLTGKKFGRLTAINSTNKKLKVVTTFGFVSVLVEMRLRQQKTI